MMPKDTNARGTIFGGVILSYIDQAAAIEAHRQFDRNFVTKAMNAVEFVAPVHVGDVVSFYTRVIRLGRTSVAVKVDVEAEGFRQGKQTAGSGDGGGGGMRFRGPRGTFRSLSRRSLSLYLTWALMSIQTCSGISRKHFTISGSNWVPQQREISLRASW